MRRVSLDANVLFSAAYGDRGVARNLFDVVEKLDEATLLATEYVIGEARRNIARKRPSRLPELETLLEAVHISAAPPARLVEELSSLVPDADDAPVLAGAVFGGADILVTGNEKQSEKPHERANRLTIKRAIATYMNASAVSGTPS